MSKAKTKKRDYSAVAYLVNTLEDVQTALSTINHEEYNAAIWVGNDNDGVNLLLDKLQAKTVLLDLQSELEVQLKEEHGIVVE